EGALALGLALESRVEPAVRLGDRLARQPAPGNVGAECENALGHYRPCVGACLRRISARLRAAALALFGGRFRKPAIPQAARSRRRSAARRHGSADTFPDRPPRCCGGSGRHRTAHALRDGTPTLPAPDPGAPDWWRAAAP